MVDALFCEITKRCNLHCPYCYCVWHESPQIAPREIPITQWIKIVDTFAAAGGKSIMFTGGEPLLKRGFEQLLRHTTQNTSFPITVFTNGTRVNEEMLQLFKECKVILGISLQGLNSYGSSTGTRRTFKHVLALLMRARELKIPTSVSTTITQLNIDEAENIVCAALACEAQALSVIPFMYEGRGNENAHLALTWGQWMQCVKSLREATGNDARVVYGNEFFCACREKLLPFTPDVPKGSHALKLCQAGKRYSVCGPSGYIRKCLHTHKNIAHWRDYFSN